MENEKVESGKWEVGSEKWKVENGNEEQGMGNEKWEVKSGKLKINDLK